jgi:hypothetical protein
MTSVVGRWFPVAANSRRPPRPNAINGLEYFFGSAGGW